eukprot:973381-Prymnesium_polylepis.1
MIEERECEEDNADKPAVEGAQVGHPHAIAEVDGFDVAGELARHAHRQHGMDCRHHEARGSEQGGGHENPFVDASSRFLEFREVLILQVEEIRP